MTDETAARLKALPRIELMFTPDAPADNPFPDGWIEDASIPWAGPKPTVEPRAPGGDVETKMAIHFAHDARDPVILKQLVRDRIARWRSGHEYEGARWGDDDQDERGTFPADKLAFGDLDMFREALTANMMSDDDTLTIEEARAKAEAVLNPHNLRIANALWSRWRGVIKRRRHNAKRAPDPDHRAKERKRKADYRRANPENAATANRVKAAKNKQDRERKAKEPGVFVAIDSEGFDTGRYLSHAPVKTGIEASLFGQTPGAEKGWVERDHDWYLNAHSDRQNPNARNKTFEGDIRREHRTFLWGAGNDEKREWLCRSSDGAPKVALNSEEILDWIVGLKRKFPNAIFVAFAFSYDASQILAGLDYQTAFELQRGER